MLPRTLSTARLTLRPHRPKDVQDVLAYATDPEWGRFLPVPNPYTRPDAEAFLAAQQKLHREQHPSWAIELEGVSVGGINIRFFEQQQVGEMGYGLARVHWGKGLATEAARAVLDAAFGALPRLRRVRAMADARNVASIAVMRSAGLQEEGVLRQNRLVAGVLIDECWYGILRAEWKSSQGSRQNR